MSEQHNDEQFSPGPNHDADAAESRFAAEYVARHDQPGESPTDDTSYDEEFSLGAGSGADEAEAQREADVDRRMNLGPND